MKVTAADLQAVAKKYFTKENRTVLYYLPDSSKN
jgi:predicted Zn-dependent peptidase